MEIISFSGKSGTGKSYVAGKVCRDYDIDAIIDDGLLIYKGTIVAGRSAKECESRAAAMRTALFNYEDHRREVQNRLMELRPKRLLVIGTSDRMVDWILRALELPEADRRIYITDINTEEERALAKSIRMEKGEHAIPVPVGQLRRSFAGYVMNPSRIFRRPFADEEASERTVVRPPFSYYGKFEISEQVIDDIITIAARRHKGCFSVLNSYHNGNESNFNVMISVRIRKYPGAGRHCIMFQTEVSQVLAKMTSFSIGNVNVQIEDVEIRKPRNESRRNSDLHARNQKK